MGNLHSVRGGLNLHEKKTKPPTPGQQTTHALQTEGRDFQEPQNSPELRCQDEVEVGSNPISGNNLHETNAKNKGKEILKSLAVQQPEQYDATKLTFLFLLSFSEVIEPCRSQTYKKWPVMTENKITISGFGTAHYSSHKLKEKITLFCC